MSKSFKKGTLFAVTGLLVVSALLRIGLHADKALALATEQFEQKQIDIYPQSAASCEPNPAIKPTLDAILSRETALAEKEALINERDAAITIAYDDLIERLAILENAEQNLLATIASAAKASKNDLDRLAQVYTAMKPKDAAALFEEMEPEFAAGFIAILDPQAAASIMTGLTPSKAYALSAILAGRNAQTPTQ